MHVIYRKTKNLLAAELLLGQYETGKYSEIPRH
jgi:hypothetical protein